MNNTQLILIVENNGMLENMLIKFILRNFPKTTFMLARDAGEGLDMTIKYQPNVIVIDMDMEDAGELSQEISSRFPNLPCIFMSGNYREEIRNRKKTLVFLEDSYHLEELKKEIQKVLRD